MIEWKKKDFVATKKKYGLKAKAKGNTHSQQNHQIDKAMVDAFLAEESAMTCEQTSEDLLLIHLIVWCLQPN